MCANDIHKYMYTVCHYMHTVSVEHYILYTLQCTCTTDTHIGIGADTKYSLVVCTGISTEHTNNNTYP